MDTNFVLQSPLENIETKWGRTENFAQERQISKKKSLSNTHSEYIE